MRAWCKHAALTARIAHRRRACMQTSWNSPIDNASLQSSEGKAAALAQQKGGRLLPLQKGRAIRCSRAGGDGLNGGRSLQTLALRAAATHGSVGQQAAGAAQNAYGAAHLASGNIAGELVATGRQGRRHHLESVGGMPSTHRRGRDAVSSCAYKQAQAG